MRFATIAVIAPGDMGHAVGRTLGEHGHRIVTALDGRSAPSRTRAISTGARRTFTGFSPRRNWRPKSAKPATGRVRSATQ